MRMIKIVFSTLILLSVISQSASAETPKVGRRAAAKYLNPVDPAQEDVAQEDRHRRVDRLIMLHVGGYSSSTSYAWKGDNKRTGLAYATYGVTYLFDAWSGIDVNVRFDFSEYKIDDDRATKLSLMPLWTFPLAETEFPLYFGFGVGAGVYFIQLPDESNLSVDYQLVAGARFLNLIDNFGAFVEFGMKNHLHLLSDGQLNGTALAAGAVFTF
jgi:hypothetical protein